MNYYVVQVKTKEREVWHNTPVREITICKDCKHFIKDYCELIKLGVGRYDFCSKGERRKV